MPVIMDMRRFPVRYSINHNYHRCILDRCTSKDTVSQKTRALGASRRLVAKVGINIDAENQGSTSRALVKRGYIFTSALAFAGLSINSPTAPDDGCTPIVTTVTDPIWSIIMVGYLCCRTSGLLRPPTGYTSRSSGPINHSLFFRYHLTKIVISQHYCIEWRSSHINSSLSGNQAFVSGVCNLHRTRLGSAAVS